MFRKRNPSRSFAPSALRMTRVHELFGDGLHAHVQPFEGARAYRAEVATRRNVAHAKTASARLPIPLII